MKTLGSLISIFQGLLNKIIPVLVMLGVVYFIWGVVNYVIADGEEAKTKGKDRIIYGIVGFAVIFGLWGLVNIVVNTFGIGGVSTPPLTSVTGASSTCYGITSSSKLQDLLGYLGCIINNSVIPLIFAVATVMFVWGVVNFFVLNPGDETKRTQGRQFMIWGVIALAVMLSVWGLVGILGNTFGINGNILPQVKPPGSSGGGAQCGGTAYGPCPGGKSCTGTSPNYTCSTID